MKPDFKDKRGVIKDMLVGPVVDGVTYITFTKNAIRGNHYHNKTVQYDYILSGKLRMKTDTEERVVKEGELVMHPKGVPHAYKALLPSAMISMTMGPRKGNEYESDTIRLKEPLL